MLTFNNMRDLEKHLQKAIGKSLKENVADIVRKVQQKNIDQTVYEAYEEPEEYIRRDMRGGLIASKNIVANLISDDTLEIKNITKPNKGYIHSMPDDAQLAQVIEYGNGYNGYKYDYGDSETANTDFKKPRPFTKNTVRELRSSKEHIKAMKEGLKQQGINFED